MNLSQAISKALAIEIRFSHSLTGRVSISIPAIVYTEANWDQRNLRDDWHLPQYNRVSFATEPEALAFFIGWYLEVRLGLKRDKISGMFIYHAKQGQPLLDRDEYLCQTKREGVSVDHLIEDGTLIHKISVQNEVQDDE